MAAFVKSVERVSVAFPSGTGLVTTTVALTKGQTPSKCAAWGNTRFTGSNNNQINNYGFAFRVFDDTGTPTLEISCQKESSGGSTVEATVIEFGTNVTVQQGSVAIASDTITETISAVNQNNSFVIFSNRGNSSSGSSSFARLMINARFNSNTELVFNRDSTSTVEQEIFYTVIESNGTDFQTEWATANASSTAKTGTATLTNTVDLDHAFIVPSYSTQAASAIRDSIFTSTLSGTNQISWYRDHNGTPSSTGDLTWWVVRSDATGIDLAQQVVIDTNSTTDGTTDQTITAVDLDKTAIITGHHVPVGDWPPVNSTSSTSSYQYKSTLELLNTTTVRVHNNRLSSATRGRDFRMAVVDFVLEAAGPSPQIIPVGQAEETDEAFEVKAITPISIAVGQAEETDTALAVTPVTGGAPQTVPVGLASETNEALEVKPVAGGVSVSIGQAEETDEAFEVKPVPGPVSVSVGISNETDLAAPVFPVLEGGPQTRLIVNAAEIDSVFPVIPRLPSEEVPGGIPTKPRKRSRKKRRYILPDNRVFTDPERALFELRQILVQNRQASVQADSDAEPPDPLEQEPASPSQESSASEPLTPSMISAAVQELPALLLQRPEDAEPIDPQLLSVLFRMIDDEEAAILLL